MKKDILILAAAKRTLLLLLTLTLLLSGTACRSQQPQTSPSPTPAASPQASPEQSAHEPSTQALIKILEENPDVKALLEKSIAKAKEINPDPETNPAQTLEGYYEYLDWAAKAMPWNISGELKAFPKLYEKIDQSLNYFYFINDMPLEELEGKGLYNNSLQYAEPYRSWLIDFTKQWGEFLSTEESWSDEYYELAREDERFGLDKDWSYRIIKQVGNYGESWTANFGPKTQLNLPRGLNNLWTQGGIMYAPPIR